MIEEKVGKYIVLNQLDSDSRKQNLRYKRIYLFKYLKKETDLSLTAIGKLFDRDHATVINGLERYEELKGDKVFYRETFELHDKFPLNFRKPLTVEIGTIKLPYKTYSSIERRNKKKKHLSLKETVIDILING